MTETVRSYSGGRKVRATQIRYGRRRIGSYVTSAAVVLLVLGLWTTRDSHQIETLIPADHAYQIATTDFLNKGERVAESRVWTALPSAWGLDVVPRHLSDKLGMPAWVLNNLLPGRTHVSGNDLKNFGDVLIVAKMTRIGCLLERFNGWIPGIEDDPAGGLELRHVLKADLYYAVRGRVLLVSRSRATLIRALTLRPEDALGEERLARVIEESGNEDVCGVVSISPDDPLGQVAAGASFALRIDPAAATLKCKLALRPDCAFADGLFTDLGPQRLQTPPDGCVEISMNFNRSAGDVYGAVVKAAGHDEKMAELWQTWTSGSATGPLLTGVAQLLAPLGPGICLTWCGIDCNEMVPVPELVARFDAKPDVVLSAFEALPHPPEDARPWDPYFRYDAATGRLMIPSVGGPSMQPIAGMLGDSLLVSTSTRAAEPILSGDAAPKFLDTPGNLYVRVRPKQAAEAVVKAGELLAGAHLLKGYTPESYQQAAAPWLANASALEEVGALVACDKGEIMLTVGLVCSN